MVPCFLFPFCIWGIEVNQFILKTTGKTPEIILTGNTSLYLE
jgi:hypothetical protein